MGMLLSGPTFIYVVEAQNGLIKIGLSANPERRARMVHQLSPVPCRLVAMWPGSRKDEIVLHRAFDAYRGHCEWFRIEGTAAEFIATIRGRGTTVEPWGGPWRQSHEASLKRANVSRSEKMKAVWAKNRASMLGWRRTRPDRCTAEAL